MASQEQRSRQSLVVFALTLTMVATAGCYESHPGLAFEPGDGAFRRDAGRPSMMGPDASVGPGPIDAGVFRDGGSLVVDGGGLTVDATVVPVLDAGIRPDGGAVVTDAGGPPDAGPPVGTDAGSPAIDAGPRRPALRFNNVTSIEVDDSPAFDADAGWTFELWLRRRGDTSEAVLCQKGEMIARHFVLGLRGGSVYGGWQSGTTPTFVRGSVIPPEVWTHVAVVVGRDSESTHFVRLLVNGEPTLQRDGEVGMTASFNDRTFVCGRGGFDIDEMRIWRGPRSDAEVAETANRRIPGSSGSLIAYWRLDEGGQLALDYSVNANVAVLGRLTTTDPEDPLWIADGVF